MFYDTQRSPPTYVVIGVVHGGSICSGFYKSLIFPEIFVRTEDSEVLEFIRNIKETYISSSKYQIRSFYFVLQIFFCAVYYTSISFTTQQLRFNPGSIQIETV